MKAILVLTILSKYDRFVTMRTKWIACCVKAEQLWKGRECFSSRFFQMLPRLNPLNDFNEFGTEVYKYVRKFMPVFVIAYLR